MENPNSPTNDSETIERGDSETSKETNQGRYKIEQPVLLGGYIAGDIGGGVCKSVDWEAVEGKDNIDPDDPRWGEVGFKPVVHFVRVPERIRLYFSNGEVKHWTPKNAILESNCATIGLLAFDWLESNSPPYDALLGLDAALNVTPRLPVELRDKTAWNSAVKELLLKEGKPDASVNVQSVKQLDLMGDGKEDVVVFAEKIKWQGECLKISDGTRCSTASDFDVEHSYGIVAIAMDGRGPLKTLLYYISNNSGLWELDGWLFADVDGDNSLEFVYKTSYYEGWWAGIIRVEEERFTEVLSYDCTI